MNTTNFRKILALGAFAVSGVLFQAAQAQQNVQMHSLKNSDSLPKDEVVTLNLDSSGRLVGEVQSEELTINLASLKVKVTNELFEKVKENELREEERHSKIFASSYYTGATAFKLEYLAENRLELGIASLGNNERQTFDTQSAVGEDLEINYKKAIQIEFLDVCLYSKARYVRCVLQPLNTVPECIVEPKIIDAYIGGVGLTAKGINDYKKVASYANGMAEVSNKVSRLDQYQLQINDRNAASYLGFNRLDAGQGNPASRANEFVGFSQKLDAVRTAHVFPEAGGLKVKLDSKPFYFCVYTRVVSYPDTRYVKTPIGAPCTGAGDRETVSSSRGNDQASSIDWFFPANSEPLLP